MYTLRDILHNSVCTRFIAMTSRERATGRLNSQVSHRSTWKTSKLHITGSLCGDPSANGGSSYKRTLLWEICPWASCQIRKIACCACVGNTGNVFPTRRLQKKPLVSDLDMHHGTCVTHVPWCMSGSLISGGRGKRSRYSRRMRTCNFSYLARGPCHDAIMCTIIAHSDMLSWH